MRDCIYLKCTPDFYQLNWIHFNCLDEQIHAYELDDWYDQYNWIEINERNELCVKTKWASSSNIHTHRHTGNMR